MIVKKVKWLWSYNIDKTEQWLAGMASKGWYLTKVNSWSRTFTFGKGEQKNVTYHIHYMPKSHSFSSTLQKEGWSIAAKVGKWVFLLNEEPIIRLFPSRDALVKRNRMHAYVTGLLAIIYISIAVQPIMLLMILSSVFGEGNTSLGNIWIPLLLVVIIIAVASFSIYVFRAYRRFEIREMNSKVDPIASGKKIRKFRGAWMYQLDETREWLEQLAAVGYELESVKAAIFTFRKTNVSNIKYECMVCLNIKFTLPILQYIKNLGGSLNFPPI